MEARQARGLVLAKNKRTKHILNGKWLVPSQSQATGGYVVDVDEQTCSCPDHETRAARCKHLWAVATIRETVRDPSVDAAARETTREVRVTYPQQWSAYNRAQTTEKEHVCLLLRGLCDGIVPPPQRLGRPRLALADVVHAAAMKVYSGMSGRRASTDVRECATKGLIGHAPHYNSIHNLIERADVTPLLTQLIEESAAPLAAIEIDFAVDGTGFATNTYARWFDHKYGREMKTNIWKKCHAMVGVQTNVITAVKVTEGTEHDSPHLPDLVKTTVQRFKAREISADKGYLSTSNLDAIEAVGAVPYIPFKSNSQGEGPAAWRRMWHLFSLHRDEFLRHYHKRSNVETAFSQVKRLFGASVRAKQPVSQTNEVLLKCLCHNLAALVHAHHELGIDLSFWKGGSTATVGPRAMVGT